ncbi:MAG TPA: hypothetical protein VMU94_05670 [Streptosporangiaceae bacterium]|nr:hypothetical protein [Streptosporangiaceae bacterium]
MVFGLVILLVRRHVPESPRWMFIHRAIPSPSSSARQSACSPSPGLCSTSTRAGRRSGCRPSSARHSCTTRSPSATSRFSLPCH